MNVVLSRAQRVEREWKKVVETNWNPLLVMPTNFFLLVLYYVPLHFMNPRISPTLVGIGATRTSKPTRSYTWKI